MGSLVDFEPMKVYERIYAQRLQYTQGCFVFSESEIIEFEEGKSRESYSN